MISMRVKAGRLVSADRLFVPEKYNPNDNTGTPFRFQIGSEKFPATKSIADLIGLGGRLHVQEPPVPCWHKAEMQSVSLSDHFILLLISLRPHTGH